MNRAIIYRNRYGRVVRLQPVLNDFWTDTGTGKFISGLVSNVNRLNLPTVKTDVSVSPETQRLVKDLQKTLLYTGLAVGGAIILNKIL